MDDNINADIEVSVETDADAQDAEQSGTPEIAPIDPDIDNTPINAARSEELNLDGNVPSLRPVSEQSSVHTQWDIQDNGRALANHRTDDATFQTSLSPARDRTPHVIPAERTLEPLLDSVDAQVSRQPTWNATGPSRDLGVGTILRTSPQQTSTDKQSPVFQTKKVVGVKRTEPHQLVDNG